MRLFIALDLPVLHRQWVATRQRQIQKAWPLPTGLRWSAPEQWHLTLRFLGECAEPRIPEILNVMKDAVAGVEPFRMSLDGLGAFSGPRMGVLWLGVATGSNQLSEIASRLEKLSNGEPKRAFRGHVTLARSRAKIPARTIRELPPAFEPCPETRVDSLKLFRSDTSPSGSCYTCLQTVPFNPSA